MCQRSEDQNLHLPRILCLHGGGTNARIFRAQCRSLVRRLEGEYRLIFAEAPLQSNAGPDVAQVYGAWGPFKSWLRWHADQPRLDARRMAYLIEAACDEAMNRDTLLNRATGEWVGLLGFSQGAKVAASLLYRQQLRDNERLALKSSQHPSSLDLWSTSYDETDLYDDDDDEDIHSNSNSNSSSSSTSDSGSSNNETSDGSHHSIVSSIPSLKVSPDGAIGRTRFRFGVLLAGRGPLVCLNTNNLIIPPPSGVSPITTMAGLPDDVFLQHSYSDTCQKLSIPTIHLHGLRDAGINLHRQLYHNFCDPQSRCLIEWDGEHRVPLQNKHVMPLVESIRRVAKKSGVATGFCHLT